MADASGLRKIGILFAMLTSGVAVLAVVTVITATGAPLRNNDTPAVVLEI